MTSNTRLRLKKSFFFLQKMETNIDIEPDFNFYLNAYISSSRSVKWVMNKEYSKVEGWEDWNKNTSSTNEEVNCIKIISKLRNQSLKEKPLVTSKEFIFPIPEGINIKIGALYKILVFRDDLLPNREIENEIKQKFGSNPINFTSKREIIRIVEKMGEDIMLLCQHYYQWLENLVNECEDQFKFLGIT